jgi:WD40 repeat protein
VVTRFLWGDDIFISYSRADGINYAAAIANELAKKEFSCRVDLWETTPGVEMPSALIRSLARSRMFVLIATERAAASAHVAAEVREFLRTGGSMIVISAGDLSQAVWYPLIAGLPLSQETTQALAAGTPSPDILSRIVNSFGYTKRNRRVRQAFWATAIAVLVITGVGGAMVEVQRSQARAASAEARAAGAQAVNATARAKSATEEAKRQRGEAERQSKLAGQKAGEAAHETVIAEEQRQLALARNLANLSSSVLSQSRNLRGQWPNLLQRAVLLAIEAARKYPSGETSIALRAAAGALPRAETVWRLSTNQHQPFLVGNHRLAAIDANHTVAVRDLTSQKEIARLATGVDIAYLVSASDGTLLTVVDKTGGVQVWNIDSKRLLWKAAGLTNNNPAAPGQFTPDGRLLVLSSADENAVILLDALTGKQAGRLVHQERVQSFHVSADSKLVVTGSNDHKARVWELSSGRTAAQLELDDTVYAVAFSPDPGDNRLAVSSNTEMSTWNWRTGQRIPFSPTRAGEYILLARFGENGRSIYGIGDHGTVWIWDLVNGQRVWSSDHADPRQSGDTLLSFDSGLTSIFAGLWTSPGVAVWDVSTDAREAARILLAEKPYEMTYARAAKYVAVVERDSPEIHLFDMRSPEEMEGVTAPEAALVEFSAARKYILTRSRYPNTRSMQIWDVAGAHQVSSPECPADIDYTTFTRDGSYLAAACSDDSVMVFETASSTVKMRIRGVPSYRLLPETDDRDETKSYDNVSALEFSPDGKHLLARTLENGGWVWEVTAGKQVARLEKNALADFSPDSRMIAIAVGQAIVVRNLSNGDSRMFAYSGKLKSVVFTGDSRFLGILGEKGPQFWRIADGTAVSPPVTREPVTTITCGPSGDTVALAAGNTVEIWSPTSGRAARMVHEGPVTSLTFAAEGAYVVAAAGLDNAKRSLLVWDVRNRTELPRLPWGTDYGKWAISPNGRYLAQHDGVAVEVYDLETGRQLSRLLHEDYVHHVAFRPDSQHLATAAQDRTAREWTLSGQEMLRLNHGREVNDIWYSGDGKRLMTGSAGAPERVWLLSDAEVIDIACRQVQRNLRPDEWRQFLGGEPYRKTCANLPVPKPEESH